MADSEAVKSLNNSNGKKKFVIQKYTQRFKTINFSRSRDKVKAEPSYKDQNKQEIKESIALEAAEEALKDDHDDAFMDVMGSKTSVLEGGEDTKHANVGGGGSGMCTVPPSKMEWLKKCDDNAKGQAYPELELEDELLVEKGSDTRYGFR